VGKLFDLEFSDERRTSVTAELFDEAAPIASENLWEAMADAHRARLHHGRHCAAELWCYLPQPKEQIPYENSTVFPDTGDILYYHFIQPPTRQGRWVYDLGIFYSQGQSRLPSGWLPGNRVGRVLGGDEAIRKLELIAADLLRGQPIEVTLRRRQAGAPPPVSAAEQQELLAGWLARLDELPATSTEADVTGACAAAEQYGQDLAAWLDRLGAMVTPAERDALRAGARRVTQLAAWWRFATDYPVPPTWNGPTAAYWRTIVRQHVEGESLP